MTFLDALIAKLNSAIDAYNAELQDAVDIGNVSIEQAESIRVPAGAVTIDSVKTGPKQWPKSLLKAVQDVIVSEDPNELVRMADACVEKTETIRHLRIGASKSPGAKPGILFGFPVGVRMIDMAHLVSHCGAGRVLLLG